MAKESKYKILRKLNWLSGQLTCKCDRYTFNYTVIINPKEEIIYFGLVNRMDRASSYRDTTVRDFISRNVGQGFLEKRNVIHFRFPFSKKTNLILKFERFKHTFVIKLDDGTFEYVYEPTDLMEEVVTKMDDYRADWEAECPRAAKHFAESRRKYPDILI